MKHGEFIKLEYTGKVSGSGEIFDLTSEEEAKKEGIFKEGQIYGPVLVILGAGMIVPGVEKELETMKPGESKEFNVKPEDAFGKRDPRLIKIVSVTQFTRSEKPFNPVPGMFVSVNGAQARVQSVSGGRVRVDFNHPLAGKELKYNVRVVSIVSGTLDRAKAVLEHYRISSETVLETGRLKVKLEKEIPEQATKILTEIIKKWVKEIKTVDFVSPKTKPSKTTSEKKTEKK
jgi:FKBP-type peptidyl-prolyl cis-trans isomerase 2